MKEALKLSERLEGAVWRYSHAGLARRFVHRHDELEFNLVISGAAKYLVGSSLYDLAPRTLVWLFPEQEHLLLDESRDYAMWVVVFRPRLLRRACRAPGARRLLRGDPGEVLSRPITPGAATRLGLLLDELNAAPDDPDRFNAGLAYALLSAWAAFHDVDAVTLGQHVHPAVQQAARLLRDDTELEKLESLAQRCHISRSRLSRLFKQQIGLSLVEYRQRQCLRRFLDLHQANPAANLLETALTAGFGSYPQFHRVFRQATGQSPRTYFTPATR